MCNFYKFQGEYIRLFEENKRLKLSDQALETNHILYLHLRKLFENWDEQKLHK